METKRTLKRQLGLFQVIMLGTAGTLGSGIFVLTGLAADVAGPATIVAILVGGLLSFSIALNYSELATVYPETGGAMTYVREAWGKGLLSFLIGSMDSISSTFYTALSAVGFAYSLSVFFPSIPIVPVAITMILLFVILNIMGVTNVGNVQIVMGIALMFAFVVFILAGLISPTGFTPAILMVDGRLFASSDFWANLKIILRTIALIYAAYVGFEVIADDAEEVKNPNKNIPVAILVSLVLITIVYSLTVLVTLGTLPWQTVAGSATALSDAIRVFLPGIGVTIIGMAGMVGALTSINSSMLSATRETFTLSRDGAWPLVLSRLNRVRVPFMAILFIGLMSTLITVIGVVDFLSYITSAGYLFVLFFSNMAMITLHKKYPDIHRPFKAPLFPLTPILASLTCVIVIIFSDVDAILFTAGVVSLLSVYYFSKKGLEIWREAHKRSLSPGRWRIILPLLPSGETDGLMKVSSLLAEAEKDLNMCLLTVLPANAQLDPLKPGAYIEQIREQRHQVLDKFIHYAVDRNVPMYTKMVADDSLAGGVVNEIRNDDNVKMVLFTCPGLEQDKIGAWNTIKRIEAEGKVNVGVLCDRGIKSFKQILVPVGGGLNSRLAIHLSHDIAMQEGSHITFIRVMPGEVDENSNEDMISHLQEIILTQLGQIPSNSSLRVLYSESVAGAILDECHMNEYDLLIMGAAESSSNHSFFGKVCDEVSEQSPFSVLLVRRHENTATSWLRHQSKRLQRD